MPGAELMTSETIWPFLDNTDISQMFSKVAKFDSKFLKHSIEEILSTLKITSAFDIRKPLIVLTRHIILKSAQILL